MSRTLNNVEATEYMIALFFDNFFKFEKSLQNARILTIDFFKISYTCLDLKLFLNI